MTPAHAISLFALHPRRPHDFVHNGECVYLYRDPKPAILEILDNTVERLKALRYDIANDHVHWTYADANTEEFVIDVEVDDAMNVYCEDVCVGKGTWTDE